jgi:VWFA-related protein
MLVLLLVTALLLPMSAQAQATQDVAIHFATTSENTEENALNLRLFFVMTDSNRKAITNPQIKAASITTDDGGNYPAKVSKATGPIAIVLVLDTSGSMGAAMKTMQQAAIQMVQGIQQQDASFAVIRFSDDIKVIQEFTTDKNRVINAIASVQAKGNTCLFDATYQGVELLTKAGITGRRAVVVFTDGKDEKAGAAGPCSKRPASDAVALATNRNLRIPIYSIGLRGSQPIAEADLRNFSQSTGGAVALGTDVNAMFKEITDSLNAQLVAEAVVLTKQGDRTATLNITFGDDNKKANPDSTVFTSPKDSSIGLHHHADALAGQSQVTTVSLDVGTKEFIVEINTENQDRVKDFRFDVISAANLLQKQVSVPAPISGPIRIPIGDLAGGQYKIQVNAIATDGRILAQSKEFTAAWQPTPTPSLTPTGTPAPVSASIKGIRYENDATKDKIVVEFLYQGREQIASLTILLRDASTNVKLKEYGPLPVADAHTLALEDLKGAEYEVTVLALGSDGRQLSMSAQRFKHAITPTPLPTFTPSATPVVVQAVLANVQPDFAANVLVFTVQVQNEGLILRYRLEFVNEATGLLQKDFTFQTPPHDTIRVPLAELPSGKYTVNLRALGEGDRILVQSQIRFQIDKPTPTPEPTPRWPVANARHAHRAHHRSLGEPSSRPVVIIIFGVVIVGLADAGAAAVPRPKSHRHRLLAEMTGAVDISQLQGMQGSPQQVGWCRRWSRRRWRRPPMAGLDDKRTPCPS